MKKYDITQIQLARELYLQFTPVSEISKRADMDRSVIYYYIKKSWQTERAEASIEALNNIADGKDAKMVDIIDSGLNIIRKNLKHIEISHKELSVQELKTITSVMTDVDKVRKLDKKKATSISATEEVETTNGNTKEVTDPFMDDNDNLSSDEPQVSEKILS
jgi:hypothetical protein